VADVTIANRDDRAQAYNLFDWKLQTPAGQVIDPTFNTDNGMLGSGDLVKGGSVTGTTTFKVGGEKGEFYIIYKPDSFDSAPGIWKGHPLAASIGRVAVDVKAPGEERGRRRRHAECHHGLEGAPAPPPPAQLPEVAGSGR
jgi:hypothetical protein